MSVFSSKTQIDQDYQRRSNQPRNLAVKWNKTRENGQKSKNKLSMHSSKPTRLVKRGNSRSYLRIARNLKNQDPSLSSFNRSSSNPLNLIALKLLRLGIVGVGLATIVGTVLANVDLTQPLFPKINFNVPFTQKKEIQDTLTQVQGSQDKSESLISSLTNFSSKSKSGIPLNNQLSALEEKIATLKAKYSKLDPGVFFIDLDNGSYADVNGQTTFPAASTIKIPILIAFFQDIDAGKIYLDQKLVMDKEVIVGGSGSMQYQSPGQKYTAIHTATEMIISSDNTATEMIIRLLGGKEVLNKRFQEWGLKATAINDHLPDLEGKNTTSPKDLVDILIRINNGELISLRSRDRLLDIMQQTKTKSLLPKGLEKEAIIAHKTGDIGTVLGDAGIIDIPTGKRYVGAVLVKRPHNDYSTRTLIQEISQTAYQHFKWYLPHPPLQKNQDQ